MITNKEFYTLINSLTLLKFTWPPKMPSWKPKQNKQYRHEVTVASSQTADYAYTLYFTSEKKARAFKRSAEQSTNDPIVAYEKKEIPIMNDNIIET